MRAFARFRLPDGGVRDLGPGDLIGRAWSATLQINDPWISEAHALVSLRDGLLKLMGLRGRFSVDKAAVSELVLAAGQSIRLSANTVLEVLEVHVPPALLAIQHPLLGSLPITGPMSLRTEPRLELVPGLVLDSPMVIWSDGELWLARVVGGDLELEPGLDIDVAGQRFTVVSTPTAEAGIATNLDGSRVDAPLVLVARYDTVHIHREGTTLVLDGLAARIVSDLAVAGVPMSWQLMARDLWRSESDLGVLRRNWDSALSRLRRKLREGGIRVDLVRSDHLGNFELLLKRQDRVEDQT